MDRDEHLQSLVVGALVWLPRSRLETMIRGKQLPGSCREC